MSRTKNIEIFNLFPADRLGCRLSGVLACSCFVNGFLVDPFAELRLLPAIVGTSRTGGTWHNWEPGKYRLGVPSLRRAIRTLLDLLGKQGGLVRMGFDKKSVLSLMGFFNPPTTLCQRVSSATSSSSSQYFQIGISKPCVTKTVLSNREQMLHVFGFYVRFSSSERWSAGRQKTHGIGQTRDAKIFTHPKEERNGPFQNARSAGPSNRRLAQPHNCVSQLAVSLLPEYTEHVSVSKQPKS